MRTLRLVCVLGCLVLLSFACASVPQKMKRNIRAGEYREAIMRGKEYLRKDNKQEHQTPVRELLEEARFKMARQVDTPEAYRKFLKRHTGSRFRDETMVQLARTQYETYTRHEDTLNAYQTFLREFPSGSYADKARQRSSRLAWRAVDQIGSIEAYRVYRQEYGDYEYAQNAYEKELSLAWNEAEDKHNPVAYLAFSKEYPDSELAPVAYLLAHKLAWTRATGMNKVRSYQEFQKLFPDSPLSAKAYEKEVALAWASVRGSGNWKKFLVFRNSYPHLPQSAKAEEREYFLGGYHRPVTSEELNASIVLADDRDPKHIALSVQVTDENRDVVGGLSREQFSLFDGPCRADVTRFEGMETSRPVDIVFVFDTTGSMRHQINGVKLAAIQFAEILRLRNMDVNLGLISFGDKVRGTYPSGKGLTGDIQSFQRWVASQEAEGGGDTPENALAGIQRGLQKKFRKDAQVVFILITDAPYHEKNHRTRWDMAKAAEQLRRKGVMLFALSPGSRQYTELVRRTGGMHWEQGKYKNFSELILLISLYTSKTYRITYTPTGCRPGGNPAGTRVRVRRGQIWSPVCRGAVQGRVTSLAVDRGKSSTVYAAAEGSGLYRSNDGAISWSRIGPAGTAVFRYEFFVGSDQGEVLALPTQGAILYSGDSGTTWEQRGNAVSRKAVFQWAEQADEIMSLDGDVLRWSTDGGRNWSMSEVSEALGTAASITADFDGQGGLLATGEDGRVWSNAEAFEAWIPTALSLPKGSDGVVAYQLYHHPYWPGVLFSVSPDGTLFRTMDGAASWAVVTPQPMVRGKPVGVKVRRVLFDPSQRHWIFLESDGGVFASDSNGRDWFELSNGVQDVDRKDAIVALGERGQVYLAGRETGNVYQLFPMKNKEYLSGNVYFAFGSAELHASLHRFLDEMAVQLRASPTSRVQIEGHTDDIGSDATNMKLSEERAESVRSYLQAKGISGARLTAVGFGESRPVFPNNSDRNRAQNRRVELTIIRPPRLIPAYSGCVSRYKSLMYRQN